MMPNNYEGFIITNIRRFEIRFPGKTKIELRWTPRLRDKYSPSTTELLETVDRQRNKKAHDIASVVSRAAPFKVGLFAIVVAIVVVRTELG